MNLFNELKQSTLSQLVELTNELKKFCNITPLSLNSQNISQLQKLKNPSLTVEKKTHVNIFLKTFDSNKKILILKTLRTITNLGLKESKHLIDSCPSIIKKNVPVKESVKIKEQLILSGAEVYFE
uniref:Ribosomal protein L12 n=1 Tax=Pterocladiophila hemisphaerica TaxID=2712948 RepID=A0A6M3WWD0_9FLOR|nr:ribosomal protein L12 [Pterocladiophila hemisphaerica]